MSSAMNSFYTSNIKDGVVPVGAFHDRSTNGLHHHIFNFDETLSRGFSHALKTMVALPEP